MAVQSKSRMVRCPLGKPLGVLGKKWTLQILRDVGYRDITRFTDLSSSVRGITRRLLSIRLQDLKAAGLIEKVSSTQSWQLTDKGRDAMKIVSQVVAFRMKWESDSIFADQQPRRIDDVFPEGLTNLAR